MFIASFAIGLLSDFLYGGVEGATSTTAGTVLNTVSSFFTTLGIMYAFFITMAYLIKKIIMPKIEEECRKAYDRETKKTTKKK